MNTQVHPVGVQIGPAVTAMRLGVESHPVAPDGNWILPGAHPIGMHPGEALKSINGIQLTVLRAAADAERYVALA